jgi:hypothetical protein
MAKLVHDNEQVKKKQDLYENEDDASDVNDHM